MEGTKGLQLGTLVRDRPCAACRAFLPWSPCSYLRGHGAPTVNWGTS